MNNNNNIDENKLLNKMNSINWQLINQQLNENGYALIPNVLVKEQCQVLIDNYEMNEQYRKTVNMKRYRFGSGEYKYYEYPLPPVIQFLREYLYPQLVPLANQWMTQLKIDKCYPQVLTQLLNDCVFHQQIKPTPLILKYGKGDFNTLHQDIYGEVYFPLQALIMLNQPEIDFTGGEFVVTQQVPRAQSSVRVIKPKQGDLLLFSTNFRPIKGNNGFYRTIMKHGVSEVGSGERHALGIIFHDALH